MAAIVRGLPVGAATGGADRFGVSDVNPDAKDQARQHQCALHEHAGSMCLLRRGNASALKDQRPVVSRLVGRWKECDGGRHRRWKGEADLALRRLDMAP
jgi:hypothetical protein